MSRGLGWMQREILASLDEAKASPLQYAGGRSPSRHGKPGRVSVNGSEVDLPESVYDLRASVQFLAKRHGKSYTNASPMSVYASSQFIESGFRISFYRAARSLIQRGHLQWCSTRGEAKWTGYYQGGEGRFVCRTEPRTNS